MIKIAVPLAGGSFCSHFGGAEHFAIYTAEEATRSITEKTVVEPPPHERGAFPTWLQGLGVRVVLAGGMGPRAQMMLAQHGVNTILGLEGANPEELAQEYLRGRLVSTGSSCEGGHLHHCHGHGQE